MGSVVCRLILSQPDMKLVATVERAGHPELGRQIGECRLEPNLDPTFRETDVLADFALAEGLDERVGMCERAGKAYVCGVTGLTDQVMAGLHRAGERIPVVYAANFSLGVNILYRLAADAARLLGPNFDIEIIETHHRYKRDAPSGTAGQLARVLSDTRGGSGEITIHSIRAGDVVGEHTVLFAGLGERLELTHRVASRDAFAAGVMLAIRFAASARPGIYSMSDIIASRSQYDPGCPTARV